MFKFLARIFGSSNERALRRLSSTVEAINSLEPQTSRLSDAELRSKTDVFKKRLSDGESLDDILIDAFAVVREVARRKVKMRPFDVQLMGAVVLHQGKIAEMATGEGKTLVATMPLYLNALEGKGCHLITVNDYLARRDREWMGPIYESLGISVGVLQHDMPPQERRSAYQSDITYGTNNEFGFDYLRDNMVIRKEDMVQRGFCYGIVDEVDNILIDEARTPLIISGLAEAATDMYRIANRVALQLKAKFVTEEEKIDAKNNGIDLGAGCDYLVDEKHRSVELTEEGMARCQKILGKPALFEDLAEIGTVHHLTQAMKAHSLFKCDVDYMVKDGQVIIVDEFTGRLMPGRRWSDGQHQAIEAKEGIKVEQENQTLATITLQNYFRLYDKLAGMTGTAETEAAEFHKIYKLGVIVIPTNKPLIRTNYSDVIYKTLDEKLEAVVAEIAELHKKERPVLVGTISIEKSETLSRKLKKRGIPHNVLNARYHEQEANIIAQAGRLGAVTIATNMAGRGTDILLGGNPHFLARERLKDAGMDYSKVSKEKFEEIFSGIEKEVAAEHEKVVALGGLHVLGTERHEARRIDNQLRGRAGRQGDPGSSRFYLSLEDDLMRMFASERVSFIMDKIGWKRGQPLEHTLLSRTIERAQQRVETHNFDIRKRLLEFDDVMNAQRQVIYENRKMMLEKEDISDEIHRMLTEFIDGVLSERVNPLADPVEWDTGGLIAEINQMLYLSLDEADAKETNREELRKIITKKAFEAYKAKEAEIGSKRLRELERMVFLQMTDSKWKDHLYELDHLREGIYYRGYGERDPLVEYKIESHSMFKELIKRIDVDTVHYLFRVRLAPEASQIQSVFLRGAHKLLRSDIQSSAPRQLEQEEIATTYKRDSRKVGRNEPCPCGSGKKYKKCCGG
jgi:preprotein translocase subunit SecA